jgi:hypothetical protein
MPNPLDRNVLPNQDRMRTTTAWILQREPVLVRIAPALVALIVIGLGVWIASARVTVYDSVPARVSDVHRGGQSDTLGVQIDPDLVEAVAGSSTLRLSPDGGRKRIDATVLEINGTRDGATLTVAASSQVHAGAASLLVEKGRRSLLSELVGTARAGGRVR